MPSKANIGQDPLERTPSIRGDSPDIGAFNYGND